MTRYYVIQNPYHDYAVQFIEHIAREYGYRPICMYTDPAERRQFFDNYPLLRTSICSESYDVPANRLAAFAATLADHYDIVGVLPVTEDSVITAAALGNALGVFAQPTEVIARFRNKFMLKDFLRREHPEIRLNQSRLLRSVNELLSEPLPERFVLKPNDGSASRRIGFFDRHQANEIREYFKGAGTNSVLMEEYIGGEEYMVNGQVGANGDIHIVAILKYERSPDPRFRGLFYETLVVPQNSEAFASVAAYATSVIAALGLKRSPFHMEVKLDETGPCLIEVAARMVGHNNAFVCNAMHNNKLNVFDVAAHYAFSSEDYGPLGVDWDYYNRHSLLYVHGIAEKPEHIYSLHGLDEVEALPHFYQWVVKPHVGGKLWPTKDLLTMPYSLILHGPVPLEALRAQAAQVRQVLGWNRVVTSRQRLHGDAQRFMRRLGRQLRDWMPAL